MGCSVTLLSSKAFPLKNTALGRTKVERSRGRQVPTIRGNAAFLKGETSGFYGFGWRGKAKFTGVFFFPSLPISRSRERTTHGPRAVSEVRGKLQKRMIASIVLALTPEHPTRL